MSSILDAMNVATDNANKTPVAPKQGKPTGRTNQTVLLSERKH